MTHNLKKAEVLGVHTLKTLNLNLMFSKSKAGKEMNDKLTPDNMNG